MGCKRICFEEAGVVERAQKQIPVRPYVNIFDIDIGGKADGLFCCRSGSRRSQDQACNAELLGLYDERKLSSIRDLGGAIHTKFEHEHGDFMFSITRDRYTRQY